MHNFFALIDFDHQGSRSFVVANYDRNKLIFEKHDESCDSLNTQNQWEIR